MVVMTALQRGIVNENTVLNTIPYRINGHEIKDVARYSELTLTGVLQKSSNVGVSKLALAMPSSALVETYSRFGQERRPIWGWSENAVAYILKTTVV